MNDAAIVEAVLFASDAPLSPADIARADELLDEERVEAALRLLAGDYERTGRALELRRIADGVQILTRPEFAPYLERFDTVPKTTRLSGAALEALGIVAYRQPISRIEIEHIRGVNSTGVIRTLLERELVEVTGRGEGVGRPVLYGTTARFLEHFGFASLEALPRPEELPVVLGGEVVGAADAAAAAASGETAEAIDAATAATVRTGSAATGKVAPSSDAAPSSTATETIDSRTTGDGDGSR